MSNKALLTACQEGDVETVQRLISSKGGVFKRAVNINCVEGGSGFTPLHLAVLHKHGEIAGLLVDCGAAVNTRDQRQMTPLHHAAWSKVAETTRLLLQNGASVNPLDMVRETPLLIASRGGQSDVVAALLEFGGDPLLQNVREEMPLDMAAQYGHVDVVRDLLALRGMGVELWPAHWNVEQPPILTALHRAASQGHTAVVTQLLEAGFDMEAPSAGGTPCHVAAVLRKPDCVKALLRAGAMTDADPALLAPLLDAPEDDLESRNALCDLVAGKATTLKAASDILRNRVEADGHQAVHTPKQPRKASRQPSTDSLPPQELVRVRSPTIPEPYTGPRLSRFDQNGNLLPETDAEPSPPPGEGETGDGSVGHLTAPPARDGPRPMAPAPAASQPPVASGHCPPTTDGSGNAGAAPPPADAPFVVGDERSRSESFFDDLIDTVHPTAPSACATTGPPTAPLTATGAVASGPVAAPRRKKQAFKPIADATDIDGMVGPGEPTERPAAGEGFYDNIGVAVPPSPNPPADLYGNVTTARSQQGGIQLAEAPSDSSSDGGESRSPSPDPRHGMGSDDYHAPLPGAEDLYGNIAQRTAPSPEASDSESPSGVSDSEKDCWPSEDEGRRESALADVQAAAPARGSAVASPGSRRQRRKFRDPGEASGPSAAPATSAGTGALASGEQEDSPCLQRRPTYSKPGTSIIKEGVLLKRPQRKRGKGFGPKLGKQRSRWFVQTAEALEYFDGTGPDNRGKLKGSIPTGGIVSFAPAGGDFTSFEVAHNAGLLTCTASNMRLRDEWLDAIETALERRAKSPVPMRRSPQRKTTRSPAAIPATQADGVDTVVTIAMVSTSELGMSSPDVSPEPAGDTDTAQNALETPDASSTPPMTGPGTAGEDERDAPSVPATGAPSVPATDAPSPPVSPGASGPATPPTGSSRESEDGGAGEYLEVTLAGQSPDPYDTTSSDSGASDSEGIGGEAQQAVDPRRLSDALAKLEAPVQPSVADAPAADVAGSVQATEMEPAFQGWLVDRKLDRWSPNLQASSVLSFADLANLPDPEGSLEAMGIDLLGHRRKFGAAVARIKAGKPVHTPTQSPFGSPMLSPPRSPAVLLRHVVSASDA